MLKIKTEIVPILLLTPILAACLSQKIEMPALTPLQTPTFVLPTRDTRKLTPNPGQTATIEAAQTPQVMENNCEGYPSNYYVFGDESLFVSPNGEWQIAYCIDPKSELPYTRLLKRQGEKIWDIPFRQNFRVDDLEIKDGALKAKKWSEDGNFVYLDSYFCCLDGPAMMFVNSYGLYRVNLETAEIKEMLPGSGYFAFSPDGAYLAGNNDSRDTVHIYDLKNDTDLAIPVVQGYSQIGIFSWSPDSQNVVFVGAFPEWENQILPESEQGGFSLLLLNVKTKSITVLMENDIRYLTPSLYEKNSWANNDEIFLFDRGSLIYTLNIQTRKIILAPTPTLNP